MHQDHPTCAECGGRSALLPLRLHHLVPSGNLCRDCLVNSYRRSIAGLLDLEPSAREIELPPGFQEGIAELELLRIEAALQGPEPATERELNDRWSRLIKDRFGLDGEGSGTR